MCAANDKRIRFAGAVVTLGEVRATIKLLRFLRAFLASDCSHCVDPIGGYYHLNKAQARRLQGELIHRAINRKAGIPDSDPDTDRDQWRDKIDVEAITRHRVRVYQFRTRHVRRRLSHLLSSYDD